MLRSDQIRLTGICARLATAGTWDNGRARADLKRLIALCWPHVDYYSRSKFVGYLDGDLLYAPPADVTPETEADIELTGILHRWPEVLDGLEGDERNFAADVEKRRRFRSWKPSDKQADWIRRIWASHVQSLGIEGDVTE